MNMYRVARSTTINNVYVPYYKCLRGSNCYVQRRTETQMRFSWSFIDTTREAGGVQSAVSAHGCLCLGAGVLEQLCVWSHDWGSEATSQLGVSRTPGCALEARHGLEKQRSLEISRDRRMPAVLTLFLALKNWKCSCSLTTEQRNEVLEAWNAVEEHDKQPQKFKQLYRTYWGNTLYCRTKRDDLVDAAVVQKLKMAKRYAPAQRDVSHQHNRLMYVLVKLLWLQSPHTSRTSPEKSMVLKAYERIHHQILGVLSKAGIFLPNINIKTVRDFIHPQERLLNLHATKQLSTVTKTTSISSAELPPAPRQPAVLPPPDYPIMQYVPTPSTAGTKVLKERTDITMPLSGSKSPSLLPPLPPVRFLSPSHILQSPQAGNSSRYWSGHIPFFSGAHIA
ncbi:hypothetical protein QTP70_015605, partial [Hemibagrus guttatus]